jgi:curli biogenesis system outer membrane secretion channel CsgG
MKRVFFAVAIFLAAGILVFAQQTGSQETSSRPTSAQTKENANQFLNQGRTNSSDFDAVLSDLNARNKANVDTKNFNKLKSDIESLEAAIKSEESKISASLERGLQIRQETLDRIGSLIEQHKAKLSELEAFAR